MFPDVIDAVRKLKADEAIFEGEALAYNAKKKRFFSFQQTMHRRRKHGIDEASKEFPLNVFVFDILYLDGRDLTNEPYRERRRIIKEKFKGRKILKPSKSVLVARPARVEKIFKQALSEGLEGIMAKDLDSPYTAGKRKFAWIKLKKSYGKAVDTVDGVIVGYYLGRGARAEFEFGGLLIAVYNPDRGRLETVAKIGSGFTEDEMVQLKGMLEDITTDRPPANLDHQLEPDFWVEPKHVVEVAFDEITVSSIHTCGRKDGRGYALRFPRMAKLRDDKTVKEITTTEEVERMFSIQHGKRR
jgi:DNA ligase-1